MGSVSDNIKNGVTVAGTVIGMATGGVAPPPNTSQLADSQQIAQQRTEPSRGDVTRKPTTSGKP